MYKQLLTCMLLTAMPFTVAARNITVEFSMLNPQHEYKEATLQVGFNEYDSLDRKNALYSVMQGFGNISSHESVSTSTRILGMGNYLLEFPSHTMNIIYRNPEGQLLERMIRMDTDSCYVTMTQNLKQVKFRILDDKNDPSVFCTYIR